MSLSAPSKQKLREARNNLNSVAFLTPCCESKSLSKIVGCKVFLKLENLQRTGSYKVRGAYNAVHAIYSKGSSAVSSIVTASAGNHAQGVAFAAARLGLEGRTTIYMPATAPEIKKARTLAFGVSIDDTADTYDAAKSLAAQRVAADQSVRNVHAFDDWDVIAGQSTVAQEILADQPDADMIVAPVGGGGLLAGTFLAVENFGGERSTPTAVFGVESSEATPFVESLRTGERTRVSPQASTPGGPLADGIFVAEPGERTWSVIGPRASKERIVTVGPFEIRQAVAALASLEGLVVEGAGAVGIAALMFQHMPGLQKSTKVVVIISGGNVDSDTYSAILSAARNDIN